MSRRRRKWKNAGALDAKVVKDTVKKASTTKYTRWCRHWRQNVELMDGLSIQASAWLDKVSGNNLPDRGGPTADVGVWLDDAWCTRGMATFGFDADWLLPDETMIRPTSEVLVPWLDRYIPTNTRQFTGIVRGVLEEMRQGKTFEVGCLGAHGRTGTFIACLLVAQGLAPDAAIADVRRKLCDKCVESPEQVAFIFNFHDALFPEKAPTARINRPKGSQSAGWEVKNNKGEWVRTSDEYWRELEEGKSESGALSQWLAEAEQRAPSVSTRDVAFTDSTADYPDGQPDLAVIRKANSDDGPEDERSWMQDDIEYNEWWELNEYGNTMSKYEAEKELNNMLCDKPPCPYVGQCNPLDGECHAAIVASEADTAWDEYEDERSAEWSGWVSL